MEFLGSLLVLLTYTLGSMQGSDGKELPVPISDVLERLVDLEKRLLIQVEKNEDLEKRLLIQEEKNADLEKRLLEQEILNAAQGEVIQNMAVCDCLSNEKATTYLSDGSLNPYISDIEDSQDNTSSFSGQMNKSLPLHHAQSSHSVSQIKANPNAKRDIVGGVAFYAYMTYSEITIGHHQTFVFDNVVTNVGGNYNRHSGIFTSPSHGVYVFSWTLFCQTGGYFYSEVVVNSNPFGVLRCGAEGATNIRHVTGIVVVEVNQGDIVYIRSHPTNSNNGGVNSHPYYRSSFTGWKLF